MAEREIYRVQLLDPETDEAVKEVDIATSAGAVSFGDGDTFQEKYDAGELTGPKGDTGATGAKGDKGDTGATGAAGSQWYSGTGITGTSTTGTVFSGSGVSAARVNDMYLNTSTGAVYKCTTAGAAGAAKWTYAGSIKGATGAKGDTGAAGADGAKGDTGATGAAGSQWYSGTGITGTSTTGTVFSGSGVSAARVNDMYLNTSTGAVYKCTTAGATSAAKWAYAGSIKGATGAKGDKGDTGATGAKGEDGDKIKVGTDYASAVEVKLFLKKM